MLSAEQNQRITQTGPGTPSGELLRRYWQPAALVEELDPARPVKAVRLMGEDLVLFRDDDGRYGLIHKQCCHRGADLAYGRVEDGGIRCPFHGWLFDVDGNCLEQPAEPDGSNFHNKVRQPSYPCEVRNGMVFAWLGPGAPPPLPDFDCFLAPDEFTFAFKGRLECNWLQAVEVGIDPAHASFLHRFFDDAEDEVYGRQFGSQAVGTNIPVTRIMRDFPRPEINVEETDYGLRIVSLRRLDDANTHIRVTNLAFPNLFVIPMSNDMIIAQWHVPIDDENNYWYAIFVDFRHRVNKKVMRDQRLEGCTLPDYRPVKNRANNWGFDAGDQSDVTYTGMGMDINVHDQWVVESMGAVQDRSIEHLGVSDKAIIANRKSLMKAIDDVEAGKPAPQPNGAKGPVAIDTIGPDESWRTVWKDDDLARRAESEWAKNPW